MGAATVTLLTRTGVQVTVAADKAEAYLTKGYRKPEAKGKPEDFSKSKGDK